MERQKSATFVKVRDHCHYAGKQKGAAKSICNSKNNISKGIPVVFQNGSNYDYQFIIKQLHVFFYKPNAYKYIQPGMSEIMSIF